MNRRIWTSWLIAAFLVFGQGAGAMPMAASDAETAPAGQNEVVAEDSKHDCHQQASEKMNDPAQMIMDSSCPENCVYCTASCVGVAVAISSPLSPFFSSTEPYADRPISSPAHRTTGLFRPPITA